jgi:hypothetical protein
VVGDVRRGRPIAADLTAEVHVVGGVIVDGVGDPDDIAVSLIAAIDAGR